MKKALLTTLGVAALGMASYAARYMQVLTDDGKIVRYDVEHVTEVNFTEDEVSPADTTPVSNHSYVDLGLPSGTLWATYNIGATKPEEFGDYFAWGETEPKKVYDWNTYKYAKAVWDEKYEYWALDSMTKYNSEDGLKVLLSEDDAATANWGVEWCMPTNEELQELVENCEYSWVEVNGVKGAKFTASNGISIFFPATDDGYADGRYWTSLLYEIDKGEANYLGIGESGAYLRKANSRYFGYSVRAIRTQKAERKKYSVKFYTSDSILIESQNVVEGMSAKEVKAPEKNGYDFVGWSAATDSVVSNMSVYALYKKTPASAHAYVDLGLPSGTLWATYNIGATKPEEFGDYFAWGETEPKEVYDWSTYKYAISKNGELDSIMKYNMKGYIGRIDSLSILLSEDDAATANWGKDWRMPTTEEQQELIDNCQREWTEINGVKGAKFTASNGNSIFLPAAGHPGVSRVGRYGYYWSSSLYEGNESLARSLYFDERGAYWYDRSRGNGYSVRAVRANK